MSLFAGIDGGQSATQAIVADESGKILGRGSAGPADEVAQTRDSTRLRDAVHGAIADALRSANLPGETHFRAAVAGISGYEGRVYGAAPQVRADAFKLVHDTENAHAGALGGEPGAIVIAGTGSVAFARTALGETALIGGWGYLFGDEGSGFWLAREIAADAMRDADRGVENELAAALLQHFGMPSLRKLGRAFYSGEMSRAQFAAFAQVAIEAAGHGSEPAAQYVRDAAGALAALAGQALRKTGMPDGKVAFVGGLTRSPAFRDELERWMRELLPQAQHAPARYGPAEGALILAYRAAGVPVPERIT